MGAGLSSRQILHEDHRLRAGQCLRLWQRSLNKVRREVRKSAGSMLTLQRMSLDLPAGPPGGGMCPAQPRHCGAGQGRRRGQKYFTFILIKYFIQLSLKIFRNVAPVRCVCAGTICVTPPQDWRPGSHSPPPSSPSYCSPPTPPWPCSHGSLH